MWEDVKPITLYLDQNNEDGSRFLLYFYSYDYELVKLKEATYFNQDGKLMGGYSRLIDAHMDSKYSANFFIEKLSKHTIKKMIEFYENPKLYIEYIV
jgi:hypothetical protein